MYNNNSDNFVPVIVNVPHDLLFKILKIIIRIL